MLDYIELLEKNKTIILTSIELIKTNRQQFKEYKPLTFYSDTKNNDKLKKYIITMIWKTVFHTWFDVVIGKAKFRLLFSNVPKFEFVRVTMI